MQHVLHDEFAELAEKAEKRQKDTEKHRDALITLSAPMPEPDRVKEAVFALTSASRAGDAIKDMPDDMVGDAIVYLAELIRGLSE